MDGIVHSALGYLWILAVVVILAGWKLWLRLFGIVIIPEDSMGLVNKKWVLFGKNRTLPDGAIIALNGEAGWQADTLAPGLHFGFWPWQYEIKREKFTTVKENFVGVVEARDGKPLSGGRVLARKVECDAFQNARAFLASGERGPQITIIPPGTYRVNTSIFTVVEHPVLEIQQNMVGIVKTEDGQPLPTGDIAGKEIEGHNMFQDAQTFIDKGGFKGLQEQVMLSGRYYVNPRFVTVEFKPMTEVPIAHVGVVIAYVGEDGEDQSGERFKHGNLVKKGQKGVWIDPLDPGKYAINPYTHKVENVPTANVVLNWATEKSESHKLDERLSSITVRSQDGFSYPLDVAQIIHIPRNDASMVIARFGSVMNLVSQVLEPTIGNYFRNSAQGSTALDFLTGRKERQDEAKAAIETALKEYSVGAINTLIGDIVPPEELMKPLKEKKVAEQEKETYDAQKLAQDRRSEMQKATALADTQKDVVKAERDVTVAELNAKSAVEKAKGEAESKKINAEADGEVLTVVGKAEGAKIKAVGEAEAEVVKLKINSMEAGNFAAIEVSKNLASGDKKWVPDIQIGGGKGEDGGSIGSVLLAGLLLEQRKNGKGAAVNEKAASEVPVS